MSIEDHWPLFHIRIKTPSLELRLPTDDDIVALADLVIAGIHDPATMPFTTEFTDEPSPGLERNSLRYWWGCRANFSAATWDLPFAVVRDGTIVGVQNLTASRFPELRTAETGSWLGRAHQGQGIGTEMRHAVLHFGFETLDARAVTSLAYADNEPSNRVSIASGYEPNGIMFEMRRGERAEQNRYLMTRQRWEDTASDAPVSVEGFDTCREMFGL